jgi:two-component system nitrogen regulation response regulator NtrX
VARLLLVVDGDTVTAATVQTALPGQAFALGAGGGANAVFGSGTLGERVDQFEKQVILDEIKRQNHHITNAAKALGLERSHLYKKCQQLGIDLQEMKK